MNKVYQFITDRIIAQLEKGVVPWKQPWIGGAPRNLVSKKAYRGINVLLLTMRGYGNPYWVTFKQAKDRGGSVKKGEKSTPVVFWKLLEKEDEEGNIEEIPLLRYYRVFNLEQCQGIKDPLEEKKKDIPPLESCEEIITNMPNSPVIEHEKTRASYSPSKDTVNMPSRNLFNSPETYYSTFFHELTHSTGHETRLNRKSITELSLYGSHEYSKEELVAEMGACFLSNHAGIDQPTFENSAAYISGWLSKLKGDPKMVINAAKEAQKAADFILDKNSQDEETD